MDQVTTLYRELAAMPNTTKDLALQQAQRLGKELYDLINDPDGSNAFFAMDQISMHEMMISQVSQGLGDTHRAVAIVKALIAAAKKNCGN